jgi:hypothetical protein
VLAASTSWSRAVIDDLVEVLNGQGGKCEWLEFMKPKNKKKKLAST